MENREAIEILSRPFDMKNVPQDILEAHKIAISALEKQESRWNNHKVACLLAEMFGDDCACNFNGIDQWLPRKCDFAETVCPHPAGVACWEQFLKHRSDEHGTD